jgi:uncharacterized membrane protein
MQFLITLVVGFVVAWTLPARLGGRSAQDAARRALGVAFVFAGASHFARREMFLAHFPSWVPAAEALVYASGVVEIVGGLALFVRRHRARVGLALAAYLVVVFPANVYVAVAGVDVPGLPDAGWYHWARLALQPLFVWWALRSTGAALPGGFVVRTLHPARAMR